MDIYAGIILITPDHQLLLQHRDNKPGIANPDKIAIFGGSAEGDETPTQCAIREIAEELELKVRLPELKELGVYQTLNEQNQHWVESHIFIVKDVDATGIILHEGQNIYSLDPHIDITALNLSPVARLALTDYKKMIR